MSGLKIGELFAGYGGLGMGVKAVFGGDVAWVSDIDKGANKILAHRFPDVPNLGDITAIDWSTVEPVDILTGGFPCQDLSHAGKRAGLKEGTRSGLWSHMARAIDELRPRLVVAENVRGLLSADAPGDVEPCPWCVGEAPTVNLRALGVVLADLADIGYDAQWCGLRAADVGACHGRFRVFLVAYPTESGRGGWSDSKFREGRRDAGHDCPRHDAAYPAGNGWDQGWAESTRLIGRPDAAERRAGDVALLPTPAVNDMGAGKSVDAWDAWTDDMRAKHGNGNGHGASLEIEAQRLLPTFTTRDHKGRNQRDDETCPTGALLPTPRVTQAGYADDGRGGKSLDVEARSQPTLARFGDYAPAIALWEAVIGRPAPSPTEPTGRDNAHRLSPRFVEWMQGLPEGWVTDVPGITRNEALKALGNGVVPQQAQAALRHMLAVERAA